ncbi:MAG TPA: MoxR family ATPase [Mycobacteriales bacterium]|nr:MoxR family ATPase [Mycobacteriales bacterium]
MTRPVRRAAARAVALDDLLASVQGEVEKVVVGQTDVVTTILGSVLVGGHVLLEGVPGVAKTLLAQAFARTLDLDFRRVQFTPDMLPSDLTGTVVLRGGRTEFVPGPVFANVVLGDEINRTPPKTQAALLEAMQESTVTVDGTTHVLPDPFLVLATQNPLELEGTYPLPEAQLDRFHVRAIVDYPSAEDEVRLLALAHRGVAPVTLEDVRPVANAATLAAAVDLVEQTRVTDELAQFVVGIVRATRATPGVQIGASPRAAVHLLAASKAAARLSGRDFVTPDDVAAVAPSVLLHRLVLTPESELERISPRVLLDAALSRVAIPR